MNVATSSKFAVKAERVMQHSGFIYERMMTAIATELATLVLDAID